MFLFPPAVVTWTAEYGGQRYSVATVDLTTAELELLGPPAPRALDDDVLAATNAGIFHSASEPVGLFVADGEEVHPLTLEDGSGNFFLKPNGVFWVDGDGAHVAESSAYDGGDDVRLATQSGPLLLARGVEHPAFRVDSPNRLLRSGVGVVDEHTVVLVVSEGGVTFHELASVFHDVLRCDDALYLDGVISTLAGPGPIGEYAGVLVARRRTDARDRDGGEPRHRP